MATDVIAKSHDGIGEINKYDFRTESKAVFKARKGIDETIVRQISEMKNEPRLDARLPAEEPGDLQQQADAQLGRSDRRQFPGHLLLPQAGRSAGQDLGRSARGNQEDV